MSKSNAFENLLLLTVFQNANLTGLGDATGVRGSTVAGSLYISLHTGDPGEAGAQNTSETTYGGYARVARARNATDFTVTGSSVSPAANIDFPACTSGTATITHFGVGMASGTAAGTLMYSGAVTPNISVSTGVTPRLTTASAITED
jgi:hypothetical protein